MTGTSTTVTDPTVRFRRVTGAILLPGAFILQLLCNALYAWVSTESGLTDTGTRADTLEFYGRYPSQLLAATVFALVGVLVMIPGLLAGLRVLRARRSRLALTAVILMITGYVSYFGVVMTNFDTLGLAQYAAAHPDANLGALLDEAPASPVQMLFFLLFIIGNIIGTALLGIAVIVSRVVPWIAGVLILGWPVGHIINIVGGGEWFAVIGGALEIAGLCILARAAVRTDDATWAARG